MLQRQLFLLMTGLVAIAAGLCAVPSDANAKRVALVIGNSAYRHVAELANPKNDAEAIASSLDALGFEVLTGTDLDRNALEAVVRDFARATRGAELALFYYAGHGLQVGGKNYLIPIDAELVDESDLDFQTVSMDAVIRNMERERRTNLIILDACRNNPLAKNLARSMGTRSTSIGRGLAPLETGVGTLISFATQPGNVALDGDGRNSPFTTALLRHINTQNLDVALMMRRVRGDVMQATGGQQVPWSNSSLTDAVYLNAGQERSENNPALSAGPDLQVWLSIKDTDSPALLESFIEQFPDSVYATFAEARRDELTGQTIASRGNGSQGTLVVHDDPPHVPGEDCVNMPEGMLLCASSVLASQGRNSYHASNLLDDKQSTAWVEGKKGDGIGEWILIDFGEPIEPGSIELRNGYTKNDDIYRKNSRIREVEIVTSTGKRRSLALQDTGAFQRIDLSGLGELHWLQMRIVSVYPGSKYKDTAVSELRIFK